MSVLPADTAAPELTTRRARRLAAALGQEATPVQEVSLAPSAAVAPVEPALTRRQLREQRAGSAFSADAVERPAAHERVTAAEVVAAAVLATQPDAMTRRELRAAALREAGAVESAPAQAPVASLEAAPTDIEYDYAAVALTLSSLTATVHVAAEDVPAVTGTDRTVAAPAVTTEPKVLEAVRTSAGVEPVQRVTQARAEVVEQGVARQWVPRLAVLSALGAATVVTPIHAMAQGTAEPEVVTIPLAESSALDTLVATPGALEAATAAPVAEVAADGVVAAPAAEETAALLAADPLADVRSAVAASRSEGRSELPQCGEPDQAQPNGALAALQSPEHLLLSMPVQEGVYRISSGFGPRWGSMHRATDFAAPVGTPIRAVASGEVVHSGGGLAGRSPNLIAIRSEIDGETVEIWYNHMFDDGVFVQKGDIVNVGDVIGEVGNNGNSTGPHLHLEIHVGNVEDPNGSAVDPLAWLRTHNATPVTTSGAVCV